MKRVSIFVLVSIIFVSILSVTAFADSSFSDQPLPLVDSRPLNSYVTSNGLKLITYYGNDLFGVANSEAYAFATTDHFLYFVSANTSCSVYCALSSSTPGQNSTEFSLTNFDTTTELYYRRYSSDFSANDSIFVPTYSSAADGFSAILSYLENSAIDVPDKSYVDIPAGYVAVLYVKNPSQWSAGALRCNFPFSSYPNAPYWGNTGQSYKFFDSRPVFTEQTLFPLSNMLTIGWTKAGSFGVGGQTTYGIGEISFGSSYNWCVIYNPFVTFDSDANNPKYNGAIRVHAGIAEAYLYPVAQLLGSDGWESRSLNDWENPYVGAAPEDDNGYWSWTEPPADPEDPPTIVIPPEGGSNEAPVEVTNQNLLSQIIGILSNLLSEIAGLFTFAFQAITGLVSLASGFFAVLGGIFAWLPSEVVTLIVSSLALIVTVGVLKSFL